MHLADAKVIKTVDSEPIFLYLNKLEQHGGDNIKGYRYAGS